jgi:sporadic carbohydrate cluster 2OG-Fe(II) oxygenase
MSSVTEMFQPEELRLHKEFLDNGFVIRRAEQSEGLEELRSIVARSASQYLCGKEKTSEVFLDEIHSFVSPKALNEFRLHIINELNSTSAVRKQYFELARTLLEMLVGNELAMQRNLNLSIQLPMDGSSLLPVHADVWSGDSPFEVVLWVPLVTCYGTKSMFLLPPAATETLHREYHSFQGKSSEAIYRAVEDELVWIDINYGDVMVFNQNLPHGNRVNEEKETRWSINCRFKSVFSPYGEKKLGEFFDPITLRPASRIGMTYKYPGESEWE